MDSQLFSSKVYPYAELPLDFLYSSMLINISKMFLWIPRYRLHIVRMGKVKIRNKLIWQEKIGGKIYREFLENNHNSRTIWLSEEGGLHRGLTG